MSSRSALSRINVFVAGSFAMAVLLMGIIAAITYRGTTGLIHASEMVSHTREVLQNLEGLLSDLADAEAGQRGYVITGKEELLEPYHDALIGIADHTKRLRELLADNPAQQVRLAKLEPLVVSRLSLIEQSIGVRTDAGFEAAQKQVVSGMGEQVMDEIRGLIAEMQGEEENLLRARDEAARSSARRAFRFAWYGSSASVVLLFLSFYRLQHELSKRQRAEASILALNQDLRDHAAQVESANKELEAFSYSVSHDLRAPLRHINGFVELLGHDTAVQDPKAARYLKYIADSARHMGHLVDDLLSFSRMSRTEMRFAHVDLDQLVQDVRKDLAGSCANRVIDWQVGELPVVHADAAMLRLVFVNLLSNAVKYTGPRPEARIEIGSSSNAEEFTIFVRDNGVGFDMKYVNKLFGVFQRLHHSDEFEGTGIGLANVRRIIDRHGGRTWAEAQLGQGATFYFSLPKNVIPKPSTQS